MVAYLFGTELAGREAGLVASALMAIVPGYISRSVAGSFDNEAVAIFALVTTFYLWVRAVRLGTVASAVACAFAYLYMAASWWVGPGAGRLGGWGLLKAVSCGGVGRAAATGRVLEGMHSGRRGFHDAETATAA